MITPFLNQIFALLTIGGQIFIVIGIIYAIAQRKNKENTLIQFFVKNAYFFAFIIQFTAMVGSLIYSNIIGYAPCDLCWYQRIFSYPTVVLLGMAIMRREQKIVDYVLALTIIGTMISIYHNYISFGGESLLPCPANGVSCTKLYVYEYGYVTIPMMMLTAFALTIFFLMMHKKFTLTKS